MANIIKNSTCPNDFEVQMTLWFTLNTSDKNKYFEE